MTDSSESTYDDLSAPLVPERTRRLLDDMKRRREGDIDSDDLAMRYPGLQMDGSAAEAPQAQTSPSPSAQIAPRGNIFDSLARFATQERPKYAVALTAVALTAFVAGGGLMLKNHQTPPMDHSLSQALQEASDGDGYARAHTVASSFSDSVRYATHTHNGNYAAGAYAAERSVYTAWFNALTNPGERLAVLTAQTESALRWHDATSLTQVVSNLEKIQGGNTDSRALLLKAAAAHHFELTAPNQEVRKRWHERAREADSFSKTNGHTIASASWNGSTSQTMENALSQPDLSNENISYRRGFEATIAMARASIARDRVANARVSYSASAPQR